MPLHAILVVCLFGQCFAFAYDTADRAVGDRPNGMLVELLLGFFETFGNEAERCLGSAVDGICKVVRCFLLGHAQNEICHIHTSRRAPDAAARDSDCLLVRSVFCIRL